jgi:FkbM family methyltransferase
MTDYEEITRSIHTNLKLDYGLLTEEFQEQVMSVKYLKGHEKVLEIGGNIGRNSMIIAYILSKHNNNNFVCLESNTDDAMKLKHNRDLNGFNFHIENAALSQRRLIQCGWQTRPSDVDIDGWKQINTITWSELQNKYNITFDTLVLDCEGAFYYILYDTPEILNNVNKILMENDFIDVPEHKGFVHETLKNNGFVVDYERAYSHYHDFYQVWLRV